MINKPIASIAIALGVSLAATQAADYVKGYTRGTGSQLLVANGGAGTTTFVDEARTGGGDQSANNGNPLFGWEIQGSWELESTVQFTGVAIPFWANDPDSDGTANTQNATHTIRFYSCGANNVFDGTDVGDDVLLGSADVNFTSADAGVDEYYANFDEPIVWDSADSTCFYFYIQALDNRAMRLKNRRRECRLISH